MTPFADGYHIQLPTTDAVTLTSNVIRANDREAYWRNANDVYATAAKRLRSAQTVMSFPAREVLDLPD